MPAVKPNKILNISGVVENMKSSNVVLNLDTGNFDIKDRAKKVIHTIPITKAYDAAYVINITKKTDELEAVSEWIRALKAGTLREISEHEKEFSDNQDSLDDKILAYNSEPRGSNKLRLIKEIAQIQSDMAKSEHLLRESQYKYREVLDFSAQRSLYTPTSFDDRTTQYPVYKLAQSYNLSKDRTVLVRS
jgi:hypothetical protein